MWQLDTIALNSIHLKIVLIFTVGFACASVLGYLCHKIKISPILGYLLAGYIIGPYSPGFVADTEIFEQLAEIGVILMMFGVGSQFKWQELIKTRKIAIPGALGQTLFALCLTVGLTNLFAWPLAAGVMLGLAIGVASTVVLVRVLSDNHLLATKEGHIAVGWLIVEDIITIFVLLMLPIFVRFSLGDLPSLKDVITAILIVIFKFSLLILFVASIGRIAIKQILHRVMRLQSRELFTVTILAFTFVVATGSTLIFGTSLALGAFVAGSLISQHAARNDVLTNAAPLKDTFVVIFFLSIGTLFNPSIIYEQFFLFLSILAVILIGKPFAAFIISLCFRQSAKTSFTIAIALAQVGEFSFILAEEATQAGILPDAGYDVIVACAFISIAINPLWFKLQRRLKLS